MTNQQLTLRHQLSRSACALLIGLAALGGASHVLAASKADNTTYQKEVAACNNGTSTEDRATCLREGASGEYAASRNNLTDPSQAQRKENAMKRCEGLPQINRVDCEKRVNGGGIADGSVREGGIFRETVTIVPGTPASRP